MNDDLMLRLNRIAENVEAVRRDALREINIEDLLEDANAVEAMTADLRDRSQQIVRSVQWPMQSAPRHPERPARPASTETATGEGRE